MQNMRCSSVKERHGLASVDRGAAFATAPATVSAKVRGKTKWTAATCSPSGSSVSPRSATQLRRAGAGGPAVPRPGPKGYLADGTWTITTFPVARTTTCKLFTDSGADSRRGSSTVASCQRTSTTARSLFSDGNAAAARSAPAAVAVCTEPAVRAAKLSDGLPAGLRPYVAAEDSVRPVGRGLGVVRGKL